MTHVPLDLYRRGPYRDGHFVLRVLQPTSLWYVLLVLNVYCAPSRDLLMWPLIRR